jgi:hypothetical protein
MFLGLAMRPKSVIVVGINNGHGFRSALRCNPHARTIRWVIAGEAKHKMHATQVDVATLMPSTMAAAEDARQAYHMTTFTTAQRTIPSTMENTTFTPTRLPPNTNTTHQPLQPCYRQKLTWSIWAKKRAAIKMGFEDNHD